MAFSIPSCGLDQNESLLVTRGVSDAKVIVFLRPASWPEYWDGNPIPGLFSESYPAFLATLPPADG